MDVAHRRGKRQHARARGGALVCGGVVPARDQLLELRADAFFLRQTHHRIHQTARVYRTAVHKRDDRAAADAGDAEERRRARRNGAADRQLISVTDDSKGAGKHAKK